MSVIACSAIRSDDVKEAAIVSVLGYFSIVCWPHFNAADIWRWMMLALGVTLAAHGAFSREIRIRDSHTIEEWWKGKVATKPWQIVYMRTLFVAIGLCCIVFALTFDCQVKGAPS